MAILPRTRAGGRLRPRERRMIAGVLAAAAALVVLIVVAFSVGGRVSGHGCVAVSIPYSTGGSQLYRCGAAARALCASAGKPSGFQGTAGAAVRAACRKAHI